MFIFSQIAKTSRNRNSLPSTQWWVLTRHSWPVEASLLLYSREPGPGRFLSRSFTTPATPTPPPAPSLNKLPACWEPDLTLFVTSPSSLHTRQLNRETVNQTQCFFLGLMTSAGLITHYSLLSFCVTCFVLKERNLKNVYWICTNKKGLSAMVHVSPEQRALMDVLFEVLETTRPALFNSSNTYLPLFYHL